MIAIGRRQREGLTPKKSEKCKIEEAAAMAEQSRAVITEMAIYRAVERGLNKE
tara:strand:- start:3593 stop:3751 length:159 start_codon:yes stop_codon:yes gene_type:complete